MAEAKYDESKETVLETHEFINWAQKGKALEARGKSDDTEDVLKADLIVMEKGEKKGQTRIIVNKVIHGISASVITLVEKPAKDQPFGTLRVGKKGGEHMFLRAQKGNTVYKGTMLYGTVSKLILRICEVEAEEAAEAGTDV